MNPIFYKDFYKDGHFEQYDKDVVQIFSNWTPRNSRVPGQKKIINFGLTHLLKKYIIGEFDKEFFGRPWEHVRNECHEVARECLFIEKPKSDHIKAVHDLGYLPLAFYSLPEGSRVPLNIPPIVVTNTKPGFNFRWLPNYFESLMSAEIWGPSTSATTARRFRELFTKHARRSGEKDLTFIDYQGHDFSLRGQMGIEAAKINGMGHLLLFKGTDTVPAILEARDYYGADIRGGNIGCSVPATEHSVVCAGMQDGEFETFRRLITETYPTGILSLVSDTWDLWKVLTDYIPRLRDVILSRTGKIVIRPDSGYPPDILCGTPCGDYCDNHGCGTSPEHAGALRLLASALGTTNRNCALPLVNNGGLIYGDSINDERADEILTRTIDDLKMSPFNHVFGIGSYAYQYVTRDTHGFAMKATAAKLANGSIRAMFKKPVTDDGGKFSHRGILAVYDNGDGSEAEPDYVLRQDTLESELDNCAYEKVFEDGKLLIDPRFETIRARAQAGI